MKKKINIIKISRENHPFHLTDSSPWPLFVSVLVLQFLLMLLGSFNYYAYSSFLSILSFVCLSYVVCNWFYSIIVESTYQGNHTIKVQIGLKMGFILFIVSEVMLFFSFFWCFFHSSLSPSIWIGSVWPPLGLEIIKFWEVPFLNTLLLLSSGVSLTWSHRAFLSKSLSATMQGLGYTILLGVIFTALQLFEYNQSSFSFNDSIYGSVFFLLTGFHGFHVLVGTLLLIVCFIRFYNYNFLLTQHLGFEFSIWYWHFVDVIWIFLYLIIYCWGC